MAVVLALVFAKTSDPNSSGESENVGIYPKFLEDAYDHITAFIATIQINAMLILIVLVYTIVLICVFMNFKNSKDDPQKDGIMESSEN